MDAGMEPAPVQGDVPQSEPLTETQVRNNAGGFVFKIDDFARLRRFIVLGSNGNNYYVSSEDLGLENCECVLRLLAEGHGLRVVEEVTRISREGRAPRQTAGILVLAVCARMGDVATRRAALAALPAVCRTASTLFEMVQRCKELGPAARAARTGDAAADPRVVTAWLAQQRGGDSASANDDSDAGAGGRGGGRGRGGHGGRGGALAPAGGSAAAAGKASWGRSMRRAVALWYLDKSPAAVAYQATKYSQRNGWSHADLLRLAHPDPEEHSAKRQKRLAAAAEAAEAADRSAPVGAASSDEPAAAAAAAVPEAAAAVPEAAAAVPEAAAADADWVMVPETSVDEGEAEAGGDGGGGGGAASELGALAAAMAATALAAADGDEAAAAAAAEAQRVADMKAIFDFLTHGTLPGQERPVRRARGRAAVAAAAGGGGEQAPVAMEGVVEGAAAADDAAEAGAAATADAAPAAAPATDAAAAPATDAIVAPAEDAAAAPAADAAAAPATDGTAAQATEGTAAALAADVNTISITDAAAAAPTDTAAAAAPTDTAAAAAPTDTAAAPAPLSPVMQYLVDANRLRKEIRAPPPLVKPPPSEAQPKRRRGRAAPEPPPPEAAAAAAPPPPDPAAVAAHDAAEAAAVSSAVSLVRRHRFSHEHVGDTALLRVPELWATFLEVGLPLTALIRNLGRMTQMGVLARPDCLARVTRRLADAAALAAARVHPMTLLEALCTYRAGAGARGVARWDAVPAVCEALEAGFYLAFKNVRPTGRRYLAGLDVSGSMGCECGGMTSVSCRQAAAAMLMSIVRAEPWLKTVAFSHQLVPMEVKPEDKLEEVVSRAEAIPMGGTDCALPILYALERRIPVDVFVILTDNETWYGSVHPAEALRRYRAAMSLPSAKLVVLAFSGTEFSIADPADPGMLDVAGLDSAVPQLVADFARGQL